ncbi:MAG TPA: hypothetical protein VEV84_03865 [Pyrinomonadaceae bacterium]|jgi:hypothetical protein|nr:hypothetical protein [Pyrinomonadaceae bacterium]
MGDQDIWEDQLYDDDKNNFAMLVLEADNEGSVSLKPKVKKIPGLKQSGTITATRKSDGKYSMNFGLGDQDIDDDKMPNPIKNLINTGGGGTNGSAVKMPPSKLMINSDYTIKPYDEYLRLFASRRWMELKVNDKPIPKGLYIEVAKFYLDQMGVPLYL